MVRMGGDFHRLVMAALAAGLLVIPGCGAGDGGQTGGSQGGSTTQGVQPKIVSASLEGSSSLRVTYSEAMKPATGVDPAKFRLTVAYYTRPASGSDKYNYNYYSNRYGYGYAAADHTIYSDIGAIEHIASDTQSADQTVLQLGTSFSLASACKEIAAINAANPNAHAGLYLHYSEAGSPTIEDLDGNKVASLAAYWSSDPTIEQVKGDFVSKPIPVSASCAAK
jgi:hypothetical protein